MFKACKFAGWHIVGFKRSISPEFLNSRIILRNLEQHVVQACLIDRSVLKNLQTCLGRYGPLITQLEPLKKLIEVPHRKKFLANTLFQGNIIGQEGEPLNMPVQVTA